MSGVNPFPQPLYVTQPLLPELDAVRGMLEGIWEKKQLTNNGEMVQRLEAILKQYLGVKYFSLFSNGTTALQIACKTLELEGEVITTPFTFAATVHSLSWCGLKPVFCDIEASTLNLDPALLEDLITPQTSALLPVHVFGTPCRTDDIDKIAKRHGLRIIYDAAHAFGVEVGGRPVGTFGDITMFSFHATKLFHTLEGGGLAYASPSMKERADSLRSFGIVGEDCIQEPGTNAKMNELQAAIGILVLEMQEREIAGRRSAVCLYRDLLQNVPGIRCFNDIEGVRYNYPYFVIRVKKDVFGLSRDELYNRLKNYNIFSRRYFHPLCSSMECYRHLPSAEPSLLPEACKASEETLALPLYGGIGSEAVTHVCEAIEEIGRKGDG